MRRILAIMLLLFIGSTLGCVPWVDAPGHVPIRDLVEGNQATIDAGHAVNYNGCWPDQGCTVFLAGHRTTHGSVFAGVASLQPGDLVRVGYGGGVYLYRVTEHVLVPVGTLIRDVLHGDLLLQTSAPNGRLHLVYAQRI